MCRQVKQSACPAHPPASLANVLLVPACPCIPAAGGDGAILAAALFYSMAVVRMTGYARSLPSVQVTGCRLWLSFLSCRLFGKAGNAAPHSAVIASVLPTVDWRSISMVL